MATAIQCSTIMNTWPVQDDVVDSDYVDDMLFPSLWSPILLDSNLCSGRPTYTRLSPIFYRNTDIQIIYCRPIGICTTDCQARLIVNTSTGTQVMRLISVQCHVKRMLSQRDMAPARPAAAAKQTKYVHECHSKSSQTATTALFEGHRPTPLSHYLRRRRRLCFWCGLFVCLSVGLLANL